MGARAAEEAHHLAPLPDSSWSIWRWMCVRGAGFPVRLIHQVAAPETVQRFERLLTMESAVAREIADFADTVYAELQSSPDEQTRKALRLAVRHLNKGSVPGSVPNHEARRHELQSAAELRDRTRRDFETCFLNEVTRISEKIVEIANDARFQTAVLLQNAGAVRRVLPILGKLPIHRDHKRRRSETLVASYLQRYCVKNDSIGFFGPTGWGRIRPEIPGVTLLPGKGLVSSSEIFFEHWGIESLSRRFEEGGALRPWIAPRLAPVLRVEGEKLYLHDGTSTPIHFLASQILSRCDGARTARQIVAAITSTARVSETELYRILNQLAEQQIIHWDFHIRYGQRPCRRLREFLEQVDEPSVREEVLAALEELETRRAAVDQALFHPAELEQALQKLDDSFSRLTNTSGTRNSGQMYAGRSLVYQDCRRDLVLDFGESVLSSLGPPLGLILDSVRWLTFNAAQLYRDSFRRTYEELVRETGKSPLDLTLFWFRSEAIHPVGKPLFEQAIGPFQSLWESILQPDLDAHELRYESAAIKPLVKAVFQAPWAGWQLARQHSPDVMICASSADEIERGDCLFVLGELHLATNTLRGLFAIAQDPARSEMLAAMEADFAAPHVWPLFPSGHEGITIRTTPTLVAAKDYYLRIYDSVPPAPILRELRIADLLVEDGPQGLVVRSRDGRLIFDLMEFMGDVLSTFAIDAFKLLPRSRHMPRILIDRLVVRRESWSFAASELAFAGIETEHERFLQSLRWQRQQGLPRYVFVRAHVERKPYFVDFESPVHVELLSQIVRRVLTCDKPDEPLTITEMLPTPEQMWVPDAQDDKYACEFRLIAMDNNEPNG